MTVQRTGRLEDPGADLLNMGKAAMERYGRIALMVLAAVAVAGVLIFFAMRSRAAAEDTAASRLAEASLLYLRGEYAQSLEMCRQIAQQYPATSSGLDAHRLAGDNSYWNGDFKTAVTEYRAFLARQKQGLLASAARRSLAYALESDRQYAEAVSTYLGLVGVFDRESSAEFLAAAARCERAAGRPAEAVKHLQRLVGEFGETSQAGLARILIAEHSGGAR